MTENILKFPIPKNPKERKKGQLENLQRRMFSHWEHGNSYFVIFDLSCLNQDKLSNIIARNGVSSIFDFRSKPIFEKPSFDHHEIINYINRMEISYYDAAYFFDPTKPLTDIIQSHRIHSTLKNALGEGLVLVILGERLIQGADKDVIRRRLLEAKPDVIEVNPSSVLF